MKSYKLVESLIILGIVSQSFLSSAQVPVGKYPGMVYINTNISNKTQICGGSLINSRFVLTTAQCLEPSKQQSKTDSEIYKVIGGEYEYDNSFNAKRYSHTRQAVLASEFFIDRGTQNPLALIRLARPVRINEYFRPVQLAQSNPSSNIVCTVIGWNMNATGKAKPKQFLLVTDVFLVPIGICEIFYEVKLNSKKILCAESIEEKQENIQGVEGGQLICYGELTGIVLCGSNYMRKDLPCTYLSISYYRSWIYKTAGRDSETKIRSPKLKTIRKANSLSKNKCVENAIFKIILLTFIICRFVLLPL